jgi:hypothetical protein
MNARKEMKFGEMVMKKTKRSAAEATSYSD